MRRHDRLCLQGGEAVGVTFGGDNSRAVEARWPKDYRDLAAEAATSPRLVIGV